MNGQNVARRCGICKRATVHESVYGYLMPVLQERSRAERMLGLEPDCLFIGSEAFKCSSCGFISLRVGVAGARSGEVYEAWYPPETFRDRPQWWGTLPNEDIRLLGAEVYSSMTLGNMRLAAMGMRALIERVAIDNTKAEGTFGQLMEALVSQGYLSKTAGEALNAALELGHAAVHRAYEPTEDDLNQAMEIIENLLQQLYLLPVASASLKARTPTRRRL